MPHPWFHITFLSSISEQILSYVELNENIDVIGKSSDRHGIINTKTFVNSMIIC